MDDSFSLPLVGVVDLQAGMGAVVVAADGEVISDLADQGGLDLLLFEHGFSLLDRDGSGVRRAR
ncbi:hypothetical protein [Streptomyces phaeochromogenes]|uniref:Uncharacterized protein n=1 Tax=Streptomyces phaeochromogenes TaxID=1923 RepID=A0ABZ1H9L3_STRPH|nr:hypothetical protein [Streptomyces phaeochromogenes]MCX4561707.1 hypothetical protein [Streptomyces phaeochromogenes]MCX5605969.1 hypothetical protein [Streptomyces phaeochromogenes]WRZ28672.1 hypothetical protein OG931_13360 [Streptomyces phaeochromogenes]WSD14252.1 hypothetical protein OHB35_13920 [Streptomyces phaeochromogenes]WSJ08805.1 hypothetical protein OG437_36855 [Streptomyces phaeochromogenes]